MVLGPSGIVADILCRPGRLPNAYRYPPGAKSYNKGKLIRIEEFELEKKVVE